MQKINNNTNSSGSDIEYSRTQMQKEQILTRLKESGCRITRQRKLLLDIILDEDCSCCKEIYYKAALHDSGIGMATVYRMVNTLESIGAISRKNMYRLNRQELTDEDAAYTVWLSDRTERNLSAAMMIDVIRTGLKEYGLISDQKIEQILIQ